MCTLVVEKHYYGETLPRGAQLIASWESFEFNSASGTDERTTAATAAARLL
eukprot:CAMPEP_0180683424 /NCGR_PEP_ID=MMETSP1037_2-20121125/71145_1 /TAXON_ID=632150 /ORGANISM="Azadinium spinosum, Strain 3D9" /LENGTH=50 /DNA_ID=CAMNT_0022713607 /DNA_START=31 /DNA_END=180 /DNA_ORIENTATION=+